MTEFDVYMHYVGWLHQLGFADEKIQSFERWRALSGATEAGATLGSAYLVATAAHRRNSATASRKARREQPRTREAAARCEAFEQSDEPVASSPPCDRS